MKRFSQLAVYIKGSSILLTYYHCFPFAGNKLFLISNYDYKYIYMKFKLQILTAYF